MARTYLASWTWFDACVITPSGRSRVNRRPIQYNEHASFKFKTPHEQLELGRRLMRDLRHWLASICPGDTLQIVPEAHYMAWTNFVAGAKIELWASPAESNASPVRTISLVKMNDHSAYTSLRQDSKEIRLVDIQPGEVEESIRLALRHTHLVNRDRLKYEALSYCWGEAKNPQLLLLTIDDMPPVGIHADSNLVAALKQLRHADTPRTLWIDLICINQTDHEERTRQVALMGEIFASADAVCVWLGEPDSDVAGDCRVIRSISEHYEKSIGSYGEPAESSQALPDRHATHDIIL